MNDALIESIQPQLGRADIIPRGASRAGGVSLGNEPSVITAMMNPFDLWTLWMRSWLQAAERVIEAQRLWLEQVGRVTEPMRSQNGRAEETRRLAQTAARMQANLDAAAAKPTRASAETGTPKRRQARPRAAAAAALRSRTAASPRRQLGRPRRTVDRSQVTTALNLVDRGLRPIEAAQRAGISKSTIYRALAARNAAAERPS